MFCILFQVLINLTICKCLDTLLAQFRQTASKCYRPPYSMINYWKVHTCTRWAQLSANDSLACMRISSNMSVDDTWGNPSIAHFLTSSVLVPRPCDEYGRYIRSHYHYIFTIFIQQRAFVFFKFRYLRRCSLDPVPSWCLLAKPGVFHTHITAGIKHLVWIHAIHTVVVRTRRRKLAMKKFLVELTGMFLWNAFLQISLRTNWQYHNW